MRASTSRCRSVCGGGLYSPFETTWVGTGESKAARSAGSVRASSASVSMLPMDSLPRWSAGPPDG